MWYKTLKKCLIISIASIMMLTILSLSSVVSASNANDMEISYTGHVQTYGWLKYSTNYTGTVGESKRMEALELNVDAPAGVTVKYRAHVQTYGWQNWVTADNKVGTKTIGTSGESKRVEAIQIVVEGASDYTIKYRTQVQTYGWLDWVEAGSSTKEAETLKPGTFAGTSGESKRMEAMQIVVIPKGQSKVEETKKEEQVLEQVQIQAEAQKQAEEQKQAKEAEKALEQAIEQKKEELEDKSETQKPSNVHTHTYTDWVTTKQPTCISTGIQTRQCVTCNYVETKQIPGDPNGHLLERTPSLDRDATCTTNGQSNTRYCAYCKQEFFNYIQPLGHVWDNKTTTKQPTCTDYGCTSIHCTRSGCTAEKDIKILNATGHNWGQYRVTKQATCIENGTKERECSKCKAVETVSTPKVQHTYSSEYTVDVEPTATTLGYESRHCTTPGCTERTSVRSVSHKHTYSDDIKIIKKGTCVEYGLEERTCTTCGKKVQFRIIPTGEHDLGEKQYSFIGNDCIGSTVYRICKICGEKVWDECFEPSLGHDWTTDDYNTAECKRCHTKINWTNAWAAEHDSTNPGFDDGWKFDGKGEMRVRRVWWVQFKADTTMSVGFNGKSTYSPNTVITADYVYEATAPEARPGYRFVAWCNAKTGERISTDTTIKAGWKYAHMVIEAVYEAENK